MKRYIFLKFNEIWGYTQLCHEYFLNVHFTLVIILWVNTEYYIDANHCMFYKNKVKCNVYNQYIKDKYARLNNTYINKYIIYKIFKSRTEKGVHIYHILNSIKILLYIYNKLSWKSLYYIMCKNYYIDKEMWNAINTHTLYASIEREIKIKKYYFFLSKNMYIVYMFSFYKYIYYIYIRNLSFII